MLLSAVVGLTAGLSLGLSTDRVPRSASLKLRSEEVY